MYCMYYVQYMCILIVHTSYEYHVQWLTETLFKAVFMPVFIPYRLACDKLILSLFKANNLYTTKE